MAGQPQTSGQPGVAHGLVQHRPISSAIYGLITVLAVLQVMDVHPPSGWAGAVTLFGTTLAVALADAYSDTIAEMIAGRGHITRAELMKIARDVAPVLTGAQAPTVLLLLSALGLMSVKSAITLAQIVSFLLLFGFGWRVGQLLHEGTLRRLVSGLTLVLIGGLVVGLKAAVH